MYQGQKKSVSILFSNLPDIEKNKIKLQFKKRQKWWKRKQQCEKKKE